MRWLGPNVGYRSQPDRCRDSRSRRINHQYTATRISMEEPGRTRSDSLLVTRRRTLRRRLRRKTRVDDNGLNQPKKARWAEMQEQAIFALEESPRTTLVASMNRPAGDE